MSYDLFFRAGARALDRAGFEAWFGRRARYSVERGHAAYANDDTGVYFSFDLGHDGVVAFNLNYFRPHVFALEAEPELSAFASAFEPVVDDPQAEGMGARWSAEGFVRGWNHGNRAAHRAFLANGGDRSVLATLPAATIERDWRFNLERETLQANLGDDVLVPKIRFFRDEGRILSSVLWPDAAPLVLPEVDRVVLLVDELDAAAGEGRSFAVIDGAAAREALAGHLVAEAAVPCTRAPWTSAPPAFRAWFLAQPRRAGVLDGVSLDRLLCSELVEEAIRA